MQTDQIDVAVVGAGLAGLTAAAYLAREGRSVRVFERAAEPGGRAATSLEDGFAFNLGPHALYRAGAAAEALRELGVPVTGGVPNTAGLALRAGRAHRLPVDTRSLLTTRLFGWRDKIEVARLLARLPRLDPAQVNDQPLAAWLETLRRPGARGLLEALARLATYTNDSQRLSAGVALAQLQLALRGVLYLDGGWRTLIDGLLEAAWSGGAEIRRGQRVEALERDGFAWRVRLHGAPSVRAGSVLLATPPRVAADLLPGDTGSRIAAWAASAPPVRAATLDLGLSELPRATTFALGIDAPYYFSVHSAAARLAPTSGAMVHVAKYLAPDQPPADERELEAVMDQVQPGWRPHVVRRRFLPNLTVIHALPAPAAAGLGERPAVVVPEAPGVYLAGDWVGATGWLADAAVASARAAAMAIRESPREQDAPVAGRTAAAG